MYIQTLFVSLSLSQDDQVKEAAKTCASFAYYNPKNMHIKANLKFYRSQSGVTEEDHTPYETKLYVSLHFHVYQHC